MFGIIPQAMANSSWWRMPFARFMLSAHFILTCSGAVDPVAPIAEDSRLLRGSFAIATGGQTDILALRDIISEIADSGPEYVKAFVEASGDDPWIAGHGEECVQTAVRLRKAWGGVRRLALRWQAERQRSRWEQAEGSGGNETVPGAHDGGKRKTHPRSAWFEYGQYLLCFGLVAVARATWTGKQPLNLFSIDVHSPVEVAVAFTLASLVAFVLVEDSRLGRMTQNPLTLYFMQVLISFLAATTTVPILVGGRHDSPLLHTVVAFGANLCFAAMWMVSDVSIWLVISDPTTVVFKHPLRVAASLTFTVLNVSLLLSNVFKLINACRKTRVQPFYRQYVQECVAYAQARIRGHGLGAKLPTRMPAALLAVAVVGTAVMAIIVMALFLFVSGGTIGATRFVVGVLLDPLQPLFESAGIPTRVHDVQELAATVTACIYAALGTGAVYTIWLISKVFSGYRRLFTALAEGKPYQGRELAQQHGSAVFQAKWATFCTGALVGNILFGFGMIVFLVLLLLLILSQKEFWEMLLSSWMYWTLYLLSFVTRQAFFRVIIPRYVVADDGTVLRPEVWGLLYATLMITNLILGATNGIIRSAVMLPYLIIQFFRIDVTYLPDPLSEWDWAFQPFMCLVVHAHHQMNPIMIAAVATLSPKGLCGVPNPSVKDVKTVASTTIDVLTVLEQPLLTQDMSRRSRSRNRWFLYVTLARNPSLQMLRGHRLAQNVENDF